MARKIIEKAVKIFPESIRLNKIFNVLKPPEIISKKLPARKSCVKELKWLKENEYRYRGYWVALFEDNLIAKDIRIKNVLNKAKRNYNLQDILLHYIPK